MHINSIYWHSRAANTFIVPMLNITKICTRVVQLAAARGDDDGETLETKLMQEAAFAHQGMPQSWSHGECANVPCNVSAADFASDCQLLTNDTLARALVQHLSACDSCTPC